MTLEQITEEVSQLDEQSRAALAAHIQQSLSPPHSKVPEKEIAQRVKEAEEDPSVLLTQEEFLSGIERGKPIPSTR